MSQLNIIASVSLSSIGKLPIQEHAVRFVPSGVERTFHAGQSIQDSGFSQRKKPARLELSLNNLRGFQWAALNELQSESITITMSDGSVYMMPSAWCESTFEVGESGMEVVFVSTTSERIT